MAGRKTKLTGRVLDTIVAHVRAGAFGWVAAAAGGISERTFYNWITRGERGEEPYAAFEAAVRQARAQARLSAELQVHRRNPLAWLRYGPGRSRRGQPGWTELHDELDPRELGQDDPAEMDELARALAEARWDDPVFAAPAEPEPGHVCCTCPPAAEVRPAAAARPARKPARSRSHEPPGGYPSLPRSPSPAPAARGRPDLAAWDARVAVDRLPWLPPKHTVFPRPSAR